LLRGQVHNENQVAFQTNDTRQVYLVDPHEYVDQVGKEIGFRRRRTVYGTLSSMDYARAGDTLSFGGPEVACQKDFTLCKFGNFSSFGSERIVSIRRATDPAVLRLAAATFGTVCARQPCAGSAADSVYAVRLESPVTLPKAGCLANVDEMSAAGSIIEGSVFRHTNANLGRTKSRDSVIRGNVFSNAAECHLDAVPLPMYLEGPWVIPNVTIENNTFEDCPRGDTIHAGAMAEVTARNNRFGSALKLDESAKEQRAAHFDGVFVAGASSTANGTAYLQLIDQARRLLAPADTEFQTISGVYDPVSTGLVEGAQWNGALWTQNT